MNLDALFQQIQLTEKQAGEKRRLIQQAKFDINRSYEKINQIKEELSTAKMKLETKVQHLSEKRFYLEVLKKREDSLEKQKAELTNQKSCLLKIFVYAKRKMTEEEDTFTREVTEFNNEYGLTSNRDLLIKKKVKTEINDLQNEAALLKNEMESMEHKNVQLNTLQLQKSELKQYLFTLQSELKDLEKVIREAEITTKDLEAEKVQVTEKPQTDPECLR
ncbi:CC172 protein, partial [Ibidorhyncha struthersii]|nr:CC172 protein [Ibidorhyncha struthersii]